MTIVTELGGISLKRPHTKGELKKQLSVRVIRSQKVRKIMEMEQIFVICKDLRAEVSDHVWNTCLPET